MSNSNTCSPRQRAVNGGQTQDNTPAHQPPTGSQKQKQKDDSPTENALMVMNTFISTLPIDLQDLAYSTGKTLFDCKVEAIKKASKASKITDDDYLPESCQEVGQNFKLKFPKIIMESEEYQTLSTEANDAIETCRKALAETIRKGTQLTADHMDVKYAANHCTALLSLAETALETLNIKKYPADLAAIDYIYEYPNEATDGTKLTLEQFLKEFKKANNLSLLLYPSKDSPEAKFVELIKEINDVPPPLTQAVTEEDSNMDLTSDSIPDLTQGSPSVYNTCGRIVLVKRIREDVEGMIFAPRKSFNKTKAENVTRARHKAFAISKMKEVQASRVSEIIGTEPPIVSAALTGIVNKQVQKETKSLQKNVQSLTNQVAFLKDKGSGRNSATEKQNHVLGAS